MMFNITLKNVAKQKGIAMVLSLLFLFVTTLLAVASMSGAVTEETMSRNTLLRERAFQIAETALKAGEQHVLTNHVGIIDDVFLQVDDKNKGEGCPEGYCLPNNRKAAPGPDEQWEIADRWTATSTFSKELSASETASLDIPADYKPRFIVEFLHFINEQNDLESCDADNNGVWDLPSGAFNTWPYCERDEKQFRITAIGYAGNNGQARVMLQSTFVVDRD